MSIRSGSSVGSSDRSTPTATSPAVATRLDSRRTLAVLLISIFIYGVLASIVVPALPKFQSDLRVSRGGATWILTAFLLSGAASTAIIGRLGDIHGKRRLLVATLGTVAVGTLLAANSNSLAMLILARAIQGTAGGILPLAFGIVRDEFPRAEVARGIGQISGVLGVGGGVGVVVPGVIIDHLGWHWLFWLPFAITVAAGVLTWRLVPESPVHASGRVNLPSACAMVSGFTSILVGVTEAPRAGWSSPEVLGLIAGGLLICGVWIMIEIGSSHPLIDMTMMRVRGVWSTNLVAFLFGGGMYAAIALYPQLAQLPKSTGVGYGASVATTGLYLLPQTAASAVFGWLAGPLSQRFGSKATLTASCLIMLVSFVCMLIQREHPYDMLISVTLLGASLGLGFAALSHLSVEAVRADQTGAASGMNTVLRMIGGAVASQLAITFVSSHEIGGLPTAEGFTDALWLLTGLLAVASAASLLVPDSGRSH